MRLTKRHYLIFLGPTLLILVVMLAFPTVYVLITSFRDYNLTDPAAGNPFVGFENYATLLSDPAFYSALWKSVLFTVASVALTFVLGMAIALLLNRRDLSGTGLTRTVILVPLILTPLVIGATYRFMLERDNGIINEILALVGFERIPFLASSAWAMISVILVDAWQWTPFAVLVLLAGLSRSPWRHSKPPRWTAHRGGASSGTSPCLCSLRLSPWCCSYGPWTRSGSSTRSSS